jgi:acetylglutamate kinase
MRFILALDGSQIAQIYIGFLCKPICVHTACHIVNKRLASMQVHKTRKPAIRKYTKHLLIYGSQQLLDLCKRNTYYVSRLNQAEYIVGI